MANLIYLKEGTSKSFKETSGDVTWTPKNVSNGNGRVSAQLDLGSGARSRKYRWTLLSKFSTATVGNAVRLYLIGAEDATTTYQQGAVGTSDATVTSEAAISVGIPLGPCRITSAAGANVWSGEVEIPHRYVSVALWNSSGVALTNTAGDHEFRLTPVPDEVQ